MTRREFEKRCVMARLEWALEGIEDGRYDEAHKTIRDLADELGTAIPGGAA